MTPETAVSFDYIAEAHVTASPSFHCDKVPEPHMMLILRDCIEALSKLDRIKKSLFYGRELDETIFVGPEDGGVERCAEVIGDTNIIHGILGIATEAGELLEALRDALTMTGNIDAINIREEVGDVFWYQALLARSCGFTFDEAQRENIAKLRLRFPDAFTEFDANNRNLAAERALLEGNGAV